LGKFFFLSSCDIKRSSGGFLLKCDFNTGNSPSTAFLEKLAVSCATQAHS